MRMTAHTTPRMIIICKRKVMRKKRHSQVFTYKTLTHQVFLLLLSSSFLAISILAKTYCNRLVKAPHLMSILGTADHQQWT